MRALFVAALDRPAAQRASFLDHACGDDVALRQDVESLIECGGDAEAWFRDLAQRAGLDRTTAGTRQPDLLRPGARVGDYEVRRLLGHGGMATVYLAHDSRHGRDVALKVLDAAFAASLGPDRFLREIRIAARLQNPHVLPVFDSGDADGRLWFAMPYVAGGSLRQKMRGEGELPVAEAVRIVRQIALALAEAHRHGIVHRDVKPENILLTPEGEPLLADFGIARPLADPHLTGEGSLLGTPAYMSPEQSEGIETIDARSDLYSLGCVLYEMLAAEPPFTGPSARNILAKRLTMTAPDIAILRRDVPKGIRDAIARVLSRSPADRFASATDFADALEHGMESGPAVATAGGSRRKRHLTWALATATAASGLFLSMHAWNSRATSTPADPSSDPPRLVVLPFRNLGPAEDSWFAEGMTDEITSRLAVLSGLRVISRTSSERVAVSGKSLREIGRELGVTYALEGTVRWDGPDGAGGRGSVRVTPQLIRVADDTHLWAFHYAAKTVEDVLGVQTAIATRVAEQLDIAIERDRTTAPAERARRSVDDEAYTAYLEARHFLNQRTGESLNQAIAHFDQAIARDSSFAGAYAGLASAQVVRPFFTETQSSLAWPAARAAANMALARDSSLAEAWAVLGFGRMSYDWDWTGAEAAFRRAIVLNPNDAIAHHWYSALLGTTGRANEALAEEQRAADLDPLSSVIHADFGWLLYTVNRLDEAVTQLDRTIVLDSMFAPAHSNLAFVYLLQHDYSRARGEAERAAALTRDPERLGGLAYVLGVTGRPQEAAAVRRELEGRARTEYVAPTTFAMVELGLNQPQRALRWLARAVDERDAFFVLNHHDPMYDSLRSDPGFVALLARIGLRP